MKNLLLIRLSRQIEELRKELVSVARVDSGELRMPKVQELSAKLDVVIAEFLKVTQEAANLR